MPLFSNEYDGETLENNSNFEFEGDKNMENDGDIERVKGDIISPLDSYPDDYTFKTGEAANILRLSAQRLRNILGEKNIGKVVKVKRNDNDQMLFTKDDIIKIEEILQRKEDEGLTLKAAINSFIEQDTEVAEVSNEVSPAKIEEMIEQAINNVLATKFSTEKFDSIEKRLNEIYDKIPEVSKEEYEKQIEDNQAKYEKELEENKAKYEQEIKENKANHEKEIVENKAKYEKELEENKTNYESKVSELETKAKELAESDSKNKELLVKQLAENDEINKKIKELEEEKAALQKQLEEQSKKRGLFGFFRK
ncbi:MAG: hypothetical protein K5931_02240 [Lachnospiraceae bacterium]|nr:hypothetical protein [Lachnospiraceae bacterium]